MKTLKELFHKSGFRFSKLPEDFCEELFLFNPVCVKWVNIVGKMSENSLTVGHKWTTVLNNVSIVSVASGFFSIFLMISRRMPTLSVPLFLTVIVPAVETWWASLYPWVTGLSTSAGQTLNIAHSWLKCKRTQKTQKKEDKNVSSLFQNFFTTNFFFKLLPALETKIHWHFSWLLPFFAVVPLFLTFPSFAFLHT